MPALHTQILSADTKSVKSVKSSRIFEIREKLFHFIHILHEFPWEESKYRPTKLTFVKPALVNLFSSVVVFCKIVMDILLF